MNHRLSAVMLFGVLASCALPGQAQSSTEAEVSNLVSRFRAAEQAYDPAALAALLSDRYVEISPAGEVDAYDRFLGFYTPDKKVPWPPMSVSEEQVRVFGDTAIDAMKLTYTMPAPDGTTRTLAMRAVFTAQRSAGRWQMIGAQFTGIRPAAATGTPAPAKP